MYLGVNYYEQKHLATAFAVFAATTMSFSAFAATILMLMRAFMNVLQQTIFLFCTAPSGYTSLPN